MALPMYSPSLTTRIPPLSPGDEAPYILNLIPSAQRTHLLLIHPSSRVSVLDAKTLQVTSTLGEEGGKDDVGSVCAGWGEEVWVADRGGWLTRWDLREGKRGGRTQAVVRQPLPLLSLAASHDDNLLVAGTELVGSDAYLVYWDPRNLAKPLYTHSQTHSDDITSLSFLPPTATLRLPRSDTQLDPGPISPDTPATAPPPPLPVRLLLSGSSDGTLALSDPREADEDEAQWAAEGIEGDVGGSVAGAGWWSDEQGVGLWARSDMDGYGSWRVARGEEGVEMIHLKSFESALFRPLKVDPAGTITRDETDPYASPPAEAFVEDEEATAVPPPKDGTTHIDYMVDVCSGLSGLSLEPSVLVGSNTGDIVLMQHEATAESSGSYRAAAFLRSGLKGHRDVVRCLYRDGESNTLYTGSEDGIVCAWQMPEPAPRPAQQADEEAADSDREGEARKGKKSKRRHGEVLDGGKKSKRKREKALIALSW